MKMKCSKKMLSFILCMVLLVAMAQLTTGCNDKTSAAVQEDSTKENEAQQSDVQETDEVDTDTTGNDRAEADVQIVGEGATVFPFNVVDKEGNETKFEIHTDKTVVGEALMELGLVEGEEGPYGLYVKKVHGIAADYDKDGVYWAFYINGEYGQTGVDVTEIKEGDNYTFKVE